MAPIGDFYLECGWAFSITFLRLFSTTRGHISGWPVMVAEGSSWAFIPQKELQDLNNQALLAREITETKRKRLWWKFIHITLRGLALWYSALRCRLRCCHTVLEYQLQPFCFQTDFLLKTPGKSVKHGPGLQVPMWESRMECPTSDFDVTLTWLLKLFGESTNRWAISLSLSLSFPPTYCSTVSNKQAQTLQPFFSLFYFLAQ